MRNKKLLTPKNIAALVALAVAAALVAPPAVHVRIVDVAVAILPF
ncbi:hypothetical protein [Kribbella sp. NPDC004536]